jgi:hypothetical protein
MTSQPPGLHGMARIGHIAIPGFFHRVTQRGNRRQQVFFEPSEYALYRNFADRALSGRRAEAERRIGAGCRSRNQRVNRGRLAEVGQRPARADRDANDPELTYAQQPKCAA